MPNYKEAADELKIRANIIDIINPIVPLRKTGANFKGCCPFHKEKTPSFIVNEDRGTYHCFGCGEHGDAVKFIQKYYNLSFTEAVDKLAAQYGISIDRFEDRDQKKRDIYYEANKLAARFFFDSIKKEANEGYSYMARRGMDAKTMQTFGVGWANPEWTDLVEYMKSKGISEDILIELGLASKKDDKYFDKFRSRVIFPIINTRDKVIGFGGRIVGEGEPKYLNSPESIVFRKKDNLYGLNKTRKAIQEEGYAILVEGYMDCVSLYQYGIQNVAASLGTALTENQAKLLSRYTKKIILCYDADSAGINAALRGIDVLRAAGLEVRVLHVDDGKDPDEYVKKHGKDAFKSLVEKKSVIDIDYKVNLLRKSYNIKDSSEGVKFLKSVAGVLRKLSPVESDIYIQKYAQMFHISERALRKEIEGEKSEGPLISPRAQQEETIIKVSPADINLEKMIIRLVLLHSDYYEKISQYPQAFVTNEGYKIKELFDYSFKKGQDFDIEYFKDALDEVSYQYLKNIIDTVITGDNELAFNDCIAKLEKNKIKLRLDEITDILSMADALEEGDVNQDYMKDLLAEYSSLQKKCKGDI